MTTQVTRTVSNEQYSEITDATWRKKASELIAEMCAASYARANYNRRGKKYKRHRPYSVPLHARVLVECLDSGDEETAKAIFYKLAIIPDALRD